MSNIEEITVTSACGNSFKTRSTAAMIATSPVLTILKLLVAIILFTSSSFPIRAAAPGWTSSFFTASFFNGTFSTFDEAFSALAGRGRQLNLFFVNDETNTPNAPFIRAWNYVDENRFTSGVIVEWPVYGATCAVTRLSDLPADECTQSLEEGRGVDLRGVGARGLTDEMKDQAACLADKIAALNIPYSGPTATVRTRAYQEHLLEIWNKSLQLEKLSDPAEIEACAAVKTELENHKKSHGLTDEPARQRSQHEDGRAIDVSNDVMRELMRTTTDQSDVEDYVNSPVADPPACNLKWGGRFQRRDVIHFQLP